MALMFAPLEKEKKNKKKQADTQLMKCMCCIVQTSGFAMKSKLVGLPNFKDACPESVMRFECPVCNFTNAMCIILFENETER